MSNDDHIIIQIVCHNRGLHVQSQWHIRTYISQSYNHNYYVQYVHLCGVHFSITLHNRGNIIFQTHNDNLYIQYLHLCGVHFSITYDIMISWQASLHFCWDDRFIIILKYICINPSTFLHVCRYLLCNHWYNIVFFIIIDPFPTWISWNYFFLCGRWP